MPNTPPRHLRSGWLPVVLLVASGCLRGGGDALTIATTWPEADCRALEAAFRRGGAADPIRIAWIRLAPGADPARAAAGMAGLDLLIGGPLSTYRALEQSGRLAPAGRDGESSWVEVRRTPVGLAVDTKALDARAVQEPPRWSDLARPALRGLLAMDDVRADPISLALARARLAATDWAGGYADLVRAAGNAQPIGRSGGAARARLGRGEAAVAPAALGTDDRFVHVAMPGEPESVEGAAVLRGARHPDRARAFLRSLGTRVDRPEGPGGPPAAEALLAELLGATLVDAQDELRSAWAALGPAEGPDREALESWMVEAPPWPPASIQVIARGDDPEPWLEVLAGEIAPDPDARAWLLASWTVAPMPIDGGFLADLAAAAEGRLAAEPRLRAWLRAEWTAWARQRYRRAALGSEGLPP